MTTTEIPTQPTPPTVNPFALRLWAHVPAAYRDYDSGIGYPLLLYIDAITQLPGAIQTVTERITGSRAVGPAAPEPWDASPDELARYRTARTTRSSDLGDPLTADAAWLPWLAQYVGADVRTLSSVPEQRNVIRYAVSGWKAGTAGSIEYAARPALVDSQYARCVRGMRGDAGAVTPWDIAIITRSSETPDPGAVLATIARAGVKPAGAVLWHVNYEASWDTLEAKRPTWDLWENDAQGVVTWDRLAETGLTYADVPGDLLTNSSFEAGLTGWTAGTNTTQTLGTGGLDGEQHAILTATASGEVSHHNTTPIAVDDTQDYRLSCSVSPDVARDAHLHADFDSGAPVDGPTVPLDAGSWGNRLITILTAPTGSTTMTVSVHVTGVGAGEAVHVDAWDAREYFG